MLVRRGARWFGRAGLIAGLALLLIVGALPAGGAALPARTEAAGHAAGLNPALAVAQASANAAAYGVTAYISVVDRGTGAVLAETGNAGTQVGSESIVKLMMAAYYLVLYGGYQSTPQDVLDRLSYMLRVSDDGTASALFSANVVPTIAARYGLGSTTNATDRVGHWGAARITAQDMGTFLWRASQDPAVGPWLLPVMAQSAPTGSDGFNQAFGMNALSGEHGSKQGWGGDSFFTPQHNAIHSVGYTDRYFVAILQTAGSYPDPMRDTATAAAQLIQASTVSYVPQDGDFVQNADDGAVYRIAGGAPIYVSDFAAVDGSTSLRSITGAEVAALPQYPADGTLLNFGGRVFVVAGGSPQYVSDFAAIGGYRPPLAVDPAALTNAGSGGVWNHLRPVPLDGTLLQAGPDGSAVYIVAGGAPTYVSQWDAIGGVRPFTRVDPAAVDNAGSPGVWAHLLGVPADGTLLQTGTDGAEVYLVAGGAATYVSNFDSIGGPRATARVDPQQIVRAGSGGYFNHLRFRPADGTLLLAGPDVYVAAGGAPIYLSNFDAIGGYRPLAVIDPAAVGNAGGADRWSHLNDTPANGTLLQAGAEGWAPVYVAAGGAPIYLASWDDVGGPRATVIIDPAAVANGDGADRWRHLRQVPVDHTVVQGSPGGALYEVLAGVPTPTGNSAGAVTISQLAVDRAGEPGVWSHLRAGVDPAGDAVVPAGPPTNPAPPNVEPAPETTAESVEPAPELTVSASATVDPASASPTTMDQQPLSSDPDPPVSG